MTGDAVAAASAGRRVAARVDALLTRDRLRNYPIIFIVLGAVSLAGNIAFGHLPWTASQEVLTPDYLAHWTGGRLLLTGHLNRLYDLDTQLGLQRQVLGGPTKGLAWFVSPPFTVVLYAPLAALPFPASAAVWTALSAGLLATSMTLLRPLLPRLGRPRYWPLVLLGFAAAFPVFELLGSGQDSALSMIILVGGLRLLYCRRHPATTDAMAGALFACGLLKPQLFAIVPLILLIRRRWWALSGWSVTAAGLTLGSLAMVGPAGLYAWQALLRSPTYRYGIQVYYAWKMQGIPSLFTALAPARYAEAAETAGIAVGLLTVVVVVVVLLRHRTGVGTDDTFALAGLTASLLSPHFSVYDLVVVIPALLVLLDRYPVRTVRLGLAALFLIPWTSALRHMAAEALPWPASGLVVAPWGAVPVIVLWWWLVRRHLTGVGPEQALAGSEQALETLHNSRCD